MKQVFQAFALVSSAAVALTSFAFAQGAQDPAPIKRIQDVACVTKDISEAATLSLPVYADDIAAFKAMGFVEFDCPAEMPSDIEMASICEGFDRIRADKAALTKARMGFNMQDVCDASKRAVADLQ